MLLDHPPLSEESIDIATEAHPNEPTSPEAAEDLVGPGQGRSGQPTNSTHSPRAGRSRGQRRGCGRGRGRGDDDDV